MKIRVDEKTQLCNFGEKFWFFVLVRKHIFPVLMEKLVLVEKTQFDRKKLIFVILMEKLFLSLWRKTCFCGFGERTQLYWKGNLFVKFLILYQNIVVYQKKKVI